MSLVSGIVVFVMIWWTVIFCVLPIGLSRTQEEAKDGEYIAPGAPSHVNMKQKVALTTVISIVLWGAVYIFIESGIINFRELADAYS